MILRTGSVYLQSIKSNTYKYVYDRYMHMVEEKINEATSQGRLETTIHLIPVLGLKLHKYKETMYTVVFRELTLKGYHVELKRFRIEIDWIQDVFKERDNNENSYDDDSDSSTGAPRIMKTDEEKAADEAIFEPKPMKMKIEI